ncbi:hypothetical protein FH972_027034 [Carpinus fangiana]|uniref:Uncharacterized protein n=1 Tax=Carpinus fangiana TaxID=176857 RepID=A0A5N6L5S8_9ROSI|nr:hypothetical protein FH972_027034 [Carpinus fangiana]
MFDKAIARMMRIQSISPSLPLVSELKPHIRLLGPMPELLPLYVRSVNRVRYASVPEDSEPDEPWRRYCFCPLPKSLGKPLYVRYASVPENPLYVRSVNRVRYASVHEDSEPEDSEPDDPWRRYCSCPLPKSLGNPCLDLFLFVGPTSSELSMDALLELAWNDNPLTTLKLILNMRELLREYSEFPLIWLYHNHPKTLAFNLRTFAECGYLKDLPLLLLKLLLHDLCSYRHFDLCDKITKFVVAYYEDVKYHFLYNHISDLFTDLLKSDLELLKSGNFQKISLAAKFCPSLNSSLDLSTFMCESIAKRLFPQNSDSMYKRISEKHYSYRVRDRLRKEVIAPLRRALNSPEFYTSLSKRSLHAYIPPAKVTTELLKETVLTRNRDTQVNGGLISRNKERYTNYNNRVRKYAIMNIPIEELLPHKILFCFYHEVCGELANLQWKKMIEHLTMKGKFKSCLASCDVSPNMNGFCSTVSVALGLLISDLSEGPWRGKIMTFSHDPQLQKIEGDDLQSRTDFMERMDWGLKIDLQKVFFRILEAAIKENIDKDKMVKIVFVFTNMDVGKTYCSNNWDIEYQAIRNKFHESGYTSLPVIVFWNLKNSNYCKPYCYDSELGLVPNGPQGVTLLKGFSDTLLRLVIENNGVLNCEAIMEMIISDKRYEKLVVYD